MEVILSRYSKDLTLDAFNHYILGNVKSTYDTHAALLHYVSAVREYTSLRSAFPQAALFLERLARSAAGRKNPIRPSLHHELHSRHLLSKPLLDFPSEPYERGFPFRYTPFY